MFRKRKIILTCLLLLTGVLSQLASAKGLVTDYRLYVGAKLGGTFPIGLPQEIRGINSYNPTFNPTIGIDAVHMFNDKLGMSVGARLEYKGMNAEVDVRHYLISVNIQDGDSQGLTRGYFSGKVENQTKHLYGTLPVLAVYRPTSTWEFRAGVWAAYAFSTGFQGNAFDGTIRESFLLPKVAVRMSAFQYDEDVRRFDAGLQLGTSCNISNHLCANADITWGLVNTLNPSTRKVDISTYNVYLDLGLGYRF